MRLTSGDAKAGLVDVNNFAVAIPAVDLMNVEREIVHDEIAGRSVRRRRIRMTEEGG